jgi:cell division protein FtsI (penicillin-binding protein 3)
VAHLPIDDPRYVVLVVVDEPQGGNAYGSTVAVPVAKQIIEALLVLQHIAPSLPTKVLTQVPSKQPTNLPTKLPPPAKPAVASPG